MPKFSIVLINPLVSAIADSATALVPFLIDVGRPSSDVNPIISKVLDKTGSFVDLAICTRS